MLTTHIYPDGDAIGSEVALAELCTRLGKKVQVRNCHHPPERFKFIDHDGIIEVVPENGTVKLPETDLILSVDTAEPSRLGVLEPLVRRSTAHKAACDHHIPPPEHPFDVVWGEEQSGATGILVLSLYDLFTITPSPRAASALFTAIASDTGWFAFNNTTETELNAAGRLVTWGASPSTIHKKMYGNSSLRELTLIGEVLSAAKAEFNGRFIWSLIQNRQLTDKGIKYGELDGIVDKLKFVRHAEIVALLIEQEPGTWKVSLRSPGNCAVNKIAHTFGGGGHAKAAGYRRQAEAFAPVLEQLKEQVQKALLAGKT